jgi:nucleoside-diphosphate-sugar epimerase
MTTIAILGATGQIAKGLAAELVGEYSLALYARRPNAVEEFLVASGLARRNVSVHGLDEPFAADTAAIVNAIGTGDPRAIRALGRAIETVTETFDLRALAHLERHRDTRYVFLSTGAVYGPDYDEPGRPEWLLNQSQAALGAGDFYPYAKLRAEARHRVRPDLSIADIRIFGYFSRYIDMEGGFLMSEIARALLRRETFRTDATDFARDYMGPRDFAQLVRCLLRCDCGYRLVEAYSAAATTKSAILKRLSREFAFSWEIEGGAARSSPPGLLSGLPLRDSAASIGYTPVETSEETIVREIEAMTADSAARMQRWALP